MVRPSFVPPPDIRGLRELTRYRKTQIRARGQEIQRLEKLFQDAGFKLTSVASRVWSQSSRAMIEMLITGAKDLAVLAELAKGRKRPKNADLKIGSASFTREVAKKVVYQEGVSVLKKKKT